MISNIIPPTELEAERAIIAQCLVSGGEVDNVKASDHRHKVILKALSEMLLLEIVVTPITLIKHLTKRKLLVYAGGANYILNIMATYKRFSDEQHKEHVDLVNKAYEKAQTIKALRKAQEGVLNDNLGAVTEAEEVLANVSGESEYVGAGQGAEMVIKAAHESYNRGGRIEGHPTGLKGLDELTGGLLKENLYILAGSSGSGKTALMLNMARFIAKTTNVLIFSLEMSSESLYRRALCSSAGIGVGSIMSGSLSAGDIERLKAAGDAFSSLKLHIDDNPTNNLDDLVSKVKKMVRWGKDAVVIVDYLQLIEVDSKAGGNREREVAKISRGLKVLSMLAKVPVIALSQIRRADETKDSPDMDMLRESSAIAQTASAVAVLWNKSGDIYNLEPDIDLHIVKNRNGMCGVVPLIFDKKTALFVERPF